MSRCPSGEVEGVGVASSLSRLERDLSEPHARVWLGNTPAMELRVSTG